MAAGAQAGPSVSAAYAACRAIARSQARNFYYAFLALPRPKRDAICAVYAFMRHADDMADDEAVPRAERRERLTQWLDAWHEALAGRPTADPVFVALVDARRRFNIPSELLDQLVHGTAMDLLDTAPERQALRANEGPVAIAPRGVVYHTFQDLYTYCYYVASVVGLVCIRIFGYRDPAAEKLAEETGVAFQLTNILRDVREDAEMGRIYIPAEDMEQFGVTPEALASTDGHGPVLNVRELLEFEARRAEHYYDSAERLLPLIDADSRPALWVLVAIYRRLLDRIAERNFDVFSHRVRLSTAEKTGILLRGVLRRWTA